MGLDVDMRVDAGQRGTRTVDLCLADGIGVMDDLPLQIGQRDDVVIDQSDGADTGRSQILQNRRAQSAGPDDQHPCRLQLLLAGSAEILQDDVAGVAFQFLR